MRIENLVLVTNLEQKNSQNQLKKLNDVKIFLKSEKANFRNTVNNKLQSHQPIKN